MKNRIKAIRKHPDINLTQQEFADRLGVKRNTIAQYEIGRNEPIDAVIFSICREFNVNEDWLRYGTGDMFVELSRDEEIINQITEKIYDQPEAVRNKIADILPRLNASDWELLVNMAELLVRQKENL